jgi:hypothetical protein
MERAGCWGAAGFWKHICIGGWGDGQAKKSPRSAAPAWLLSGSDINLTLGEAVKLQTGNGILSWAKVQTETRDGVIRMTFPTLSEGGFFVNGDEGDVKQGQTGFYTLLKPVKIGDTLILEYAP